MNLMMATFLAAPETVVIWLLRSYHCDGALPAREHSPPPGRTDELRRCRLIRRRSPPIIE